jgi:hypothetical protein
MKTTWPLRGGANTSATVRARQEILLEVGSTETAKFGAPHYESCENKKWCCNENIRSRTWENNSDYEHLARS